MTNYRNKSMKYHNKRNESIILKGYSEKAKVRHLGKKKTPYFLAGRYEKLSTAHKKRDAIKKQGNLAQVKWNPAHERHEVWRHNKPAKRKSKKS